MKINFKTLRHFFTLSLGSLFSFFINIVVLVAFSKLYSKEQFGDYAIFVSVVGLLSIITTFRIEHLIVLKKTTYESAILSNICKKIITYFTGIILLLCIFLFLFSFSFFNQQPFLWLFVPLTSFFLSHIIVFLSWNNKIKNYKLISKYKIIQSISVGFVGVFFGYFYKDFGLIFAYIFGLLLSYLLLNFSYIKFVKKFNFNFVTVTNIKETFIEHKTYIKNSFGLEFFNTISKYIPNFILNAYYGNAIVGVYDMTLKVLNIPKNIFSLNIGELYYQKASIFYYKSKEQFSHLTLQIFYTLLLVSVICYSPFILFGEELFVFFLGNEWRLSGEISSIISIWIMLLFISSPMAYIFYIRRTLSKLFLFISISFVIKIFILLFLVISYSKIETIYNYTSVCIFLEIILIYIILKQLRGSKTITP
jgi:O-antigen/teichoic acid export membrane protein